MLQERQPDLNKSNQKKMPSIFQKDGTIPDFNKYKIILEKKFHDILINIQK